MNLISAPSHGGLPRRVAVVHNTDFQSKEVGVDSDEPPSLEADSEVATTARDIAAILNEGGVETRLLTLSDSPDELPGLLADFGADAVFNLVESLGNNPAREVDVPILLEALHMPYTGNSPSPLKIAHAKDIARQILEAHHIPQAWGFAVHSPAELPVRTAMARRYPLFVKPARTDASIGIDQRSIVHSYAELRERVEFLFKHLPGPMLVESYLPGRELNVAIFPDPYTGMIVPTEIDFSPFPKDAMPIVTYDCKWREDSPEYLACSRPADWMPAALHAEVIRVARAAFLAVGGNSYGRVDMRLDTDGHPAVIDVNPNPDLDRLAGLAIAARSLDVDYASLIYLMTQRASVKESHVPAPYTTARPRGLSCAAGAY